LSISFVSLVQWASILALVRSRYTSIELLTCCTGSMSTDNRFFKAGFASVQRRVLLDPGYTNDAVKSFSLTDIDGSFTAGITGGGCGAVIVSAVATLYSSACGFQSGTLVRKI
jgi:hypothetical protein